MTNPRPQLSIFPSVPKERQVVDKDGALTPSWALYFQQLDTALQTVFGAEGVVIPAQTNANISLLVNSIPGTMLYSSDGQTIRVAIPNSPPTTVTWKTLTPT